ncbi:MAG: N-6 DNA methylase [Chlorobaculum sp.]|nr:N-6 DNA methylase [Chlorobaculum sp.]
MPQPLSGNLFDLCTEPVSSEVRRAVEWIGTAGSAESRGAVFTRPEVVEFILDLIGYTEDQPLFERKILEPSFGHGDFLLAALKRLLASCRSYFSKELAPVERLADAVVAVELHADSFAKTLEQIAGILVDEGYSASDADLLVSQWLHQGDFLLTPLKGRFDYVVGNPPYVRQELLASALLVRYRQLYRTIYDRADLYVPFIERSLGLLNQAGHLGFICSDRWMKNRYGGPLREFVSRDFNLDVIVDMNETPAFHSGVSAYTAVTVFSRDRNAITRMTSNPPVEKVVLEKLAVELRDGIHTQSAVPVREIHGIVNDAEPWIFESSVRTRLLRRLEDEFPTLEKAACKVGIGVATGADKVFIGKAFDVESDRLLPLLTGKDIRSGRVEWSGKLLVNPYADDGALVDLRCYPRLARYFDHHRESLSQRHCARKSPDNWYKTIDRVWPELTRKPKLLIPDIKGSAHIVFDPGHGYPHHNLYYVISDSWDLRALQAVLLSGISQLFIDSYSTRIRGGYLRFQAQYLRRIRMPYWRDVSEPLRDELRAAAEAFDIQACNVAVSRLYGLSCEEIAALGISGG